MMGVSSGCGGSGLRCSDSDHGYESFGFGSLLCFGSVFFMDSMKPALAPFLGSSSVASYPILSLMMIREPIGDFRQEILFQLDSVLQN